MVAGPPAQRAPACPGMRNGTVGSPAQRPILALLVIPWGLSGCGDLEWLVAWGAKMQEER